MEIATRNVIFPGSVGLAQAHPLTKPLAMGDGLPPDLVQLRSTLPIRALVLGFFFFQVSTASYLEHFFFSGTGEKGNRLELSVNESKYEGAGRVS